MNHKATIANPERFTHRNGRYSAQGSPVRP